MKFCPYCGSHLNADARFCVACGAKQPTDLPSPILTPCAPSVQRNKRERKDVLHALRALLVIAVALSMLVTAFLPCFAILPEKDAYEEMGLENVEFRISAFQAVRLWLDTAKQLDEDELYDSGLMLDILDCEIELAEELEEMDEDELERLDEYSELPSGARRAFDRMMFLTLRLSMQSEQTATPYSLIALGLLSILYLLLALAAFVFGVLYLLSACGAFESGRFRRMAVSLGLALPMTLIALRTAMSMTFGPNGISFLSASAVALALGAVLWIACLIFAILEGQMPRARAILWRIPAAAVAVLLLFAVEGTVFSVGIKTEFDGDDDKRRVELDQKASFFNALLLSDFKYEEIDEWVEDMDSYDVETDMELRFEKFSFYTKNEVEKGEADELNLEILQRVGACDGFHDTMSVFAILPVLYLMAAMSACAVLWQLLLLTAGERYRRDAVISAKIVGAVAALGALVMLIAYLSTVNGYISDYMPGGYKLSIGAGIIVSAIVALGAVFCPSRIKPREKRQRTVPEAEAETPAVGEIPVDEVSAD